MVDAPAEVEADDGVQADEADQSEAEAEVTKPEAKAPRKPDVDRGRGRPDAKRICNPQPTLDLKKRFVRQAGGTMEFKNRQWEIEVNGEKFSFPSRQLAGMTAGELCKAVGIEIAEAKAA